MNYFIGAAFFSFVGAFLMFLILGLFLDITNIICLEDLMEQMSTSGLWACLIVLTVIFMVLAYKRKAKAEACPQCKRKSAMKEISRQIVRQTQTTVDVVRKARNSNGDVVRTYTEAVPATMYIYDCIDKCKYCGYCHHVTRDEVKRSHYTTYS